MSEFIIQTSSQDSEVKRFLLSHSDIKRFNEVKHRKIDIANW